MVRISRYPGIKIIGAAEARPSLAQLLTLDLAPAVGTIEQRAAAERVRPLLAAPWYLCGAHLSCAGALGLSLALSGSLRAAALPAILGGWLMIACLAFFLAARTAKDRAPHRLAVAAFLFALGSAIGWLPVIPWVATNGHPAAACIPLIALLATLAAFRSIPAVTLVNCSAVIGAVTVWAPHGPLLLATVMVCCASMLLSLHGARDALLTFKRRIEMEWEAQKAVRFVAEFEQSGRGWFWETNADGALSYVSDQLAEDLEAKADDLAGLQFADLLMPGQVDSDHSLQRTLGFHLSTRFPFSDISVRAKAEQEVWWSLSGSPIFDDYGRFLGFRGIGADLTEKRRSEAEISRLARYDSLTGLPNRALMRQTLEEALAAAEARKSCCSLFVIDLDRFKNVNDTLGHPVGDALLRQVAQRLAGVIGEQGQIGRLGGDEFTAVLPGLDDPSRLGGLADRLIQQVSMPYLIEGHNISIGASVGVAVAPAVGSCADALTRDADLALYAAKTAGRGTHRFFAPEMHSEARDRQLLEHDLRNAVARGELRLVYQPVVSAGSEDVIGFEALLRWDHPERGAISPSVFIPLAEECGLIISIGEWVLRTACAEAAKWPGQIRIAVNLSPIQFTHQSLLDTVRKALAETQLAPERLELEITEGVFLVDSAATDDTFARLKAIKVRLALDDFGTGYSSLGYLKKAPFDKIKIDQSFVRGASFPGSRNAAIIRSIVMLAESLGMDTTAEGAETHDELALIRELGCSQVQGYIFGRPMSAEEALALSATARPVVAQGFQVSRSPRQGLLKMATLQWSGVTFPVRLRNISSGGALLESDRSLATGSHVQLDLPDVGNFGGEVRWSQSGRLGIRFEQEFDLRRLNTGQRRPAVATRVPTREEEPVAAGPATRPVRRFGTRG